MQRRTPRPCGEHDQERFKCTREAQDAPTAVVQPWKEGFPQDTPRCKLIHLQHNPQNHTSTVIVWYYVCLILFVWHQATTKDIKDSLGKQWTQLSDKKRLKWITKSLEQRKLYEVRQLWRVTCHARVLLYKGCCEEQWWCIFHLSSVLTVFLFAIF